MQVTEANQANPDGSIIYHSGMNPKIQRNPSTPLGTLSLPKGFEVFTPCEFIAAITQHPPTLKLRRTSIPRLACPTKPRRSRDYDTDPDLANANE
jgi:hypothetical protein